VFSNTELREFLEEKVDKYNRLTFIDPDPISIPHQFTKKEDIEISAFLTATISWGRRVSIIKNANKMMQIMDHSPYEFVIHATDTDLNPLKNFVHRTFNGDDCIYFIRALQNIYLKHEGLEQIFANHTKSEDRNLKQAIINFRKIFFYYDHPGRTKKHISDPGRNSAAKKINMFLRWMVRSDKKGFDFGIWDKIGMDQLSVPLDVHTGNVARKLGLLDRMSDDWKAVEELTENLRKFDPKDPVKYDFAMFGLGIYENF